MPYSLVNRRISQNIVFQPRKKLLASAIGGDLFVEGDYKYHVFKSTDSFRVFYKTTGSFFEYAVVGGSGTGSAGNGSNGGRGGYSFYSLGNGSFSNFNLNTGYPVTIGGAGFSSSIATNSTTITSGNSGILGGAGGSGYGAGPECTGMVTEEDNCCCYDCDNNGVTCCDGNPDCDPDPANCGCCRGYCSPGDPGYACGTSFVCTTNCEQCSGAENSAGASGNNGFMSGIAKFGPYGTSFIYGQSGGGGGGGGGGGSSGGGPNGGNGGYPVGNGGNGAANSGVGGGGGGGQQLSSEYCTNFTECTAGMEGGGGPTDAAPGTGGAGASGIVFIRYKFQE